MRTQDYWISQYKQKDALWMHDGNPKRPHALLTSGKHSNGFFNSRLVIPDEALLCDAASDLLELFALRGGNVAEVEAVVGPQTGATKLAELISKQLPNVDCFFASPAKCEVEGRKSMTFSGEELVLLPGKLVLLCEDVLTTGGSVGLTTAAVFYASGFTLPFVLALVNRSGLKEVNDRKIVALIDRPMPMWMAEECPLCQQGSEAIRPKGPQEWARLNAKY
jgi:orotate phosphoribosyltransferase